MVPHRIPFEAIQASTNWWGRQFRSPEPLEDNYNGVALVVADLAERGDAPGVDQITAFRDKLSAMLVERAAKIETISYLDRGLLNWHGQLGLEVRIDYDPDPILEMALANAEISKWWLPRKALTWTLPQCSAAGVDERPRIIWESQELPPLTCLLPVNGGGSCALDFLHSGPHVPQSSE